MAVNEPAEIVLRQEDEHPVAGLERPRKRVLVVTIVGYIGYIPVRTIFAITDRVRDGFR